LNILKLQCDTITKSLGEVSADARVNLQPISGELGLNTTALAQYSKESTTMHAPLSTAIGRTQSMEYPSMFTNDLCTRTPMLPFYNEHVNR
jgi:hypothetical protein